MNETIAKRQDLEKKLLLEQLRKMPVIESACQKVNISRASYYRWRAKSKEFAKKADEALQEGSLLINDLAEGQLMSAIRDRNLTAIIFWLRNHHPIYKDRVEIKGELKHQYQLTSEQEKLISKALTMVIGKGRK